MIDKEICSHISKKEYLHQFIYLFIFIRICSLTPKCLMYTHYRQKQNV